MLQRQVCAIVGSLLFLFALTGGGHSADMQSPSNAPGLMRLSASLAAKRAGTILVVGSSSTVGLGASSPLKTYVAQLQLNLQRAFPGANLRVVARGVSGEMAQGAAARMKREVAATRPALVIWQVGTNDALGHYAMERFENCLQRTLAWLKDQGVDVILLNPQYGEALIKDAYYEKIVSSIARVSAQENVLLVDRFGSMRGWARDRRYLSKDNLHMNDESYARLAELLTSTIVKALDRDRAIVAAID
jgi:acyl-CoA thioesterase I